MAGQDHRQTLFPGAEALGALVLFQVREPADPVIGIVCLDGGSVIPVSTISLKFPLARRFPSTVISGNISECPENFAVVTGYGAANCPTPTAGAPMLTAGQNWKFELKSPRLVAVTVAELVCAIAGATAAPPLPTGKEMAMAS